MSRSRSALAMLLALTGMLLLAGSASAKDRNHDRIPDRWEKRHHLSLHVNQARRDQDRDGLRNRAEFRAGTDPRDSDTDGDSIRDSEEHAGTIVSFTDGVLKIAVFGRTDPLVGTVDASTEIECESSGATAASSGGSSDDGPGHDQGDDHGDGADDGPGHDQGDDHGDDSAGDDHGDDSGDDSGDDGRACGIDQLVAGVKVDEAELRLSGGTAVFEKLELRP